MRTTFYLLIGIITLFAQSLSAQCPTAFCQDLNTSFMPEACMVEVWAKDFVAKVDMGTIPVDNYWISFEENTLVMNKVFRSEDGKKQDVTIWVAENADGTGCKSRCDVVLTIRDNTGDCPERDFAICPIEPNPWCGYAVLSCSAEEADDVVATILDIRRNDLAPRGDDWAAPNMASDTLNIISPAAWRLGNLGMIFGMARRVETGEIFMAASDVYAFDYGQLVEGGFVSVGFPPPTATGSAGPGGIYRTMFGTDPNAITANPIIFTNASTYLEAADAIGGNFISNFGNFDGTVLDPVGLTNNIEQFDSMATTSGNGLGNITYDRRSNHLFATNLEDGKIYSINCSTNTITDVFDPFDAYNHSVEGRGIVKPSERVWGVAIRPCTGELYFSRNTTSTATLDHLTILPKTVHKVDISPSGRFIQADGAQDLVLAINDRGTQNKITDISFDISCNRMLLAERGHPHKSRLFEYVNNGTSWSFGQQYYVGIYDDTAPVQPGMDIVGSSTGGGAAYGPSSDNSFVDADCDQLVWSTVHCGDAANVPGRCDIYGLQGISADGNDTLTTNTTDIFIGLEADPGNNVLRLKNNLGDVDIFNCCCPDGPRNAVNTGTSAIAGRVLTPTGNALNDVEVVISTQELKRTALTDINGGYTFGDIPMNQDYMVQSNTSGEALDGITTLDIVQIQRHILGIQSFDEDYKILAGDVDGSGTVSASDLVNLRRMILGKTASKDQTWRLLSMSSMEDDSQPLDYTIVDNLQNNIRNIDFVALKVGDVNYDNSRYLSAKGRSTESLDLILKTQSNGSVDFIASEDISTSGFQLVIETRGVLISLASEIIDISSDNYSFENDLLKISWNGNSLIEKGEKLFTIRTSAIDEKVKLVTTEIMQPEIYNSDLQVVELNLINDFASSETENLIASPNPFSDLIDIQIHSEDKDQGTLYVIDHIGRVAFQTSTILDKGTNKINIDLSSQPTGVYTIKAVLSDRQIYTQVVKIEY